MNVALRRNILIALGFCLILFGLLSFQEVREQTSSLVFAQSCQGCSDNTDDHTACSNDAGCNNCGGPNQEGNGGGCACGTCGRDGDNCCACNNNPPPPPPPPPSPSISCNPGSLYAGRAATIIWDCDNSTSSTGGGFSTGGALSGSATVYPAEIGDNVYTLTCIHSSNGTSAASCTIDGVDPNLSLVVDPTSIYSGEVTTVSWSAQGVDQCLINSDDGQFKAPFTVGGSTTVSGSQDSGTITEETTYYLECSNPGATFERTATIRLGPSYSED